MSFKCVGIFSHFFISLTLILCNVFLALYDSDLVWLREIYLNNGLNLNHVFWGSSNELNFWFLRNVLRKLGISVVSIIILGVENLLISELTENKINHDKHTPLFLKFLIVGKSDTGKLSLVAISFGKQLHQLNNKFSVQKSIKTEFYGYWISIYREF